MPNQSEFFLIAYKLIAVSSSWVFWVIRLDNRKRRLVDMFLGGGGYGGSTCIISQGWLDLCLLLS